MKRYETKYDEEKKIGFNQLISVEVHLGKKNLTKYISNKLLLLLFLMENIVTDLLTFLLFYSPLLWSCGCLWQPCTVLVTEAV